MNLRIRTDNIEHQHQSDLINKLKICYHDTIKDYISANLILAEINKRISNGEWEFPANSSRVKTLIKFYNNHSNQFNN